MAVRKLNKTFDIVEHPWWNQYSLQEVGELLDNVNRLRKIINEQVTVDDLYWKGYENVHHTKYLLECITGESNDTTLTYLDVEKILNAGFLRMLCNFLFCRKTYRRMKKLKNLNRAAKIMFPNIYLLEASPLHNLNIEYVRKLHQQVGKGVIPNAGNFRTRDAGPAQENYLYMSPHLIEHRLQNLLEECQHVFADPNLTLTDCIKYGACFFSEFLFIHPFSNGNGRVGRLFLSYLLTKYTVVPLSLYSLNSARNTYLQCLRETRKFHSEFNKPASLSRFILENIERELMDLCYMIDLKYRF